MQSNKILDMENQQAKINFLNNEIKQLNERVLDLEEMVLLNKEALKSALNLKCETPNSAEPKPSGEREGSSSNYRNVIKNLQNENNLLNSNLERLIKERNFCQSQVIYSL
jgi:hypothetical protein